MRRVIEVLGCSLLDAGYACVVNASNERATLGGGVSRALFEECGGALLQREMTERLDDEFGGVLEQDECLVTSGGSSTRVRFVLHVASVDYRGINARHDIAGRVVRSVTSVERVRSCSVAVLRAAADLAAEHGPLSVAFPLLGAGSGGLAPEAAVRALVAGFRAFFAEAPEASIDRVVVAVPEADRLDLCRRVLAQALA